MVGCVVGWCIGWLVGNNKDKLADWLVRYWFVKLKKKVYENGGQKNLTKVLVNFYA